MDHTATIAKSRTTSLPVLATFKGHQMAQMAETYKQWLDRGEPVADAAVAKRLAARMNGLPEGPRKQCKAEFVARFGRPEQLRASLVDDAEAMVAGYEQTEPLPDAVVPA